MNSTLSPYWFTRKVLERLHQPPAHAYGNYSRPLSDSQRGLGDSRKMFFALPRVRAVDSINHVRGFVPDLVGDLPSSDPSFDRIDNIRVPEAISGNTSVRAFIQAGALSAPAKISAERVSDPLSPIAVSEDVFGFGLPAKSAKKIGGCNVKADFAGFTRAPGSLVFVEADVWNGPVKDTVSPKKLTHFAGSCPNAAQEEQRPAESPAADPHESDVLRGIGWPARHIRQIRDRPDPSVGAAVNQLLVESPAKASHDTSNHALFRVSAFPLRIDFEPGGQVVLPALGHRERMNHGEASELAIDVRVSVKAVVVSRKAPSEIGKVESNDTWNGH